MTLCPPVGGTLGPTPEKGSGPGWVVQEEPAAAASRRTSTSGAKGPAAWLWSSFRVAILNPGGFEEQR